jgi:SAM-dependent methyltransferase
VDPTNTQFLVHLSGYRWVADTFGPLGARRVLDVASGEGYGSGMLAANGATVVGVDLDRVVVSRARGAYPGAHFFRMDAVRLGFRAETFDLVISQDTLEHIEDDAGFVAEVERVLARDGVLVLFTPHARVHTGTPANPYHVREYSAESLQALLGMRFGSVRLFGRRPAARMRGAERGLDAVRRWDLLGLRRLVVPPKVRHRLGSWILRRQGGAALETLSTADVEYCEGVADSGTLVAVCRKRRAG